MNTHHTHDGEHACDADCDHDHDHSHSPTDELITVRDLVRYATSRFNRNKLFFGHGLPDAFDEAVQQLGVEMPVPRPHPRQCLAGRPRALVGAL